MVKKKSKCIDELGRFIRKISKEEKEKAIAHFNKKYNFHNEQFRQCDGKFEFQKGKIKLTIQYEDHKTEEMVNYVECKKCKKRIPLRIMYGCYYYAKKYPNV